jgi:hypothetical protein
MSPVDGISEHFDMLRVGYTLQVKLFDLLWSSRLCQSATEVDNLPYCLTYKHTQTHKATVYQNICHCGAWIYQSVQ